VITLYFLPSAARAGEVLHSYVEHDSGHYLLHLEMRLAAALDSVYAVLLDFDNLSSLNDSIIGSQLLEKNAQHYRVLLITKGCLWFFCRQVKQVQTVMELGRGYLTSTTDPAVSDLASGKVLWHVRPDPRQEGWTLITYSADFEPGFWVPPLIGPWLMKRRLLQEGRETIFGIEAQADADSH